MTPRQPIGYWVKLLDQLIDASFVQALGAQNVSRRHWQALNVIQREPTSRQRLDEALAPFLFGSETTTGPIVDDLLNRGWISSTGDRYMLTVAGEAAVASLQKAVDANRARLAEGITEEQYATTVDTLARMCANLQ